MTQADPSALNAITPVRRGWQVWLRFLWRVLKRLEKRRGGKPKGVLMNTSMIHAAGWSVIREVNCGIHGQEPHRLKRPYLLFESNFSGALRGYLETFSFVDALGLRAMWQMAYQFPNPAKASHFFEFVDTRQLKVDRCYSAYSGYPEATTSMIRAAMELQRRITHFEAERGYLPAPKFAAAYRSWLPDVQTIRNPEGQAGRTFSFCAVCVIETPENPDEKKQILQGLRDIICALDAAELAISLEGRVPQKTHFARLTVADKFLQSFEDDEAKHDPTAYLMFSTWFDGASSSQARDEALDSHLRALFSRFGGQAGAIWSHCRGFETVQDARGFCEYLCGHEVDMGMPFWTFPGKPVAEVRAALALARRFSQFVVAVQDEDRADELRNQWELMLRGPQEPPDRRGAVREEVPPLTPVGGKS